MINDYFRIGILLIIIVAIVMWFFNNKVGDVATLPLFILQMKEHVDANGKFDLFRILSWIVIFFVPVFLYGNFMTPLVYNPPPLPGKMRTTLATITKKDESLIRVIQTEPGWLKIVTNPKFVIDEEFCRANEIYLENGCHIDILNFYVYRSGEILVEFSDAKTRTRRMAGIWIVHKDGTMIQDTRSHSYGYIFGNHRNSTIKVGFAETIANIKNDRFPEHARHVPEPKIVKIFPLRSRREENAIHKLFDSWGARENDDSKGPGRELFDSSVPEVAAWIAGLDEIYEDKIETA